jgi:hypothetical protein
MRSGTINQLCKSDDAYLDESIELLRRKLQDEYNCRTLLFRVDGHGGLIPVMIIDAGAKAAALAPITEPRLLSIRAPFLIAFGPYTCQTTGEKINETSVIAAGGGNMFRALRNKINENKVTELATSRQHHTNTTGYETYPIMVPEAMGLRRPEGVAPNWSYITKRIYKGKQIESGEQERDFAPTVFLTMIRAGSGVDYKWQTCPLCAGNLPKNDKGTTYIDV